MGVTLLSDGKTDTTTTDQSVSPLSSSPGTSSDSISTDGVEDMELDDSQNIAALKDSGNVSVHFQVKSRVEIF